ncbi:MAG TPA: hypothetical protein VLC08_00545 [Chitinolyticbacter sp.]|nr:hypothetical protein [Chitinolyticbacter sp.]
MNKTTSACCTTLLHLLLLAGLQPAAAGGGDQDRTGADSAIERNYQAQLAECRRASDLADCRAEALLDKRIALADVVAEAAGTAEARLQAALSKVDAGYQLGLYRCQRWRQGAACGAAARSRRDVERAQIAADPQVFVSYETLLQDEAYRLALKRCAGEDAATRASCVQARMHLGVLGL